MYSYTHIISRWELENNNIIITILKELTSKYVHLYAHSNYVHTTIMVKIAMSIHNNTHTINHLSNTADLQNNVISSLSMVTWARLNYHKHIRCRSYIQVIYTATCMYVILKTRVLPNLESSSSHPKIPCLEFVLESWCNMCTPGLLHNFLTTLSGSPISLNSKTWV